jgi:uncharacterized repeat protein (TIGR03803 family)
MVSAAISLEENMQKRFSLLALALMSFGFCLPALAQTYTYSTLYSFKNVNDGKAPSGPSALIVDTAGNLYGTTAFGGEGGAGTVYELSAEGVYTSLHAFDRKDGYYPQDLTRDSQGNLYGSTWQIGYPGTVFKIVPGSAGHYTFTNLYDVADAEPEPGSLTVDSEGNVFGSNGVNPENCLCFFEIPAGGQWEDIYSTGGLPAYPGNVLIGSAGGVYASVNYDGPGNTGYIIEVAGGTQRYEMPTEAGGAYLGGQDAAGNIYGLTGGEAGVGAPLFLFKLELSTGTISRIYTFTDGGPFGPLVVDSAGNTYGASASANRYVFKITPQGKRTVLYTFPKNGPVPGSGLVTDGAGNLYGYTYGGGTYNSGTIYKLSPGK